MKTMRTMGAIAVFAVAVSAYLGCKKETTLLTQKPATAMETAQTGDGRMIRQKMYNVSEDAMLAAIDRLKHGDRYRLVHDSVPIDSSIWVLEAALNFDLDLTDGGRYEAEWVTENAQVSVNTTMEVSSDDLEDAYEELSTEIASHTNTAHKVKVIDVTATLSTSGTLTYSAMFALMSITSTANPCQPAANVWYYSGDLAAMLWPAIPMAPNGQRYAENYLNCPQDMSCGERVYFLNIDSMMFFSNGNITPSPYSNALFANAWNTLCGHNSNQLGNVYITGGQVNSYISNMQSLAYNVPTGTNWILCRVPSSSSYYWATSGCTNNNIWSPGLYCWGWDLVSLYGNRYCASWPQE